MVVIERRPFLQPQVVAIPVIAIVLKQRDLVEAKTFHNPSYYGRLSGTGSPSHTDHERAHPQNHIPAIRSRLE
jgi:hypothetical protein